MTRVASTVLPHLTQLGILLVVAAATSCADAPPPPPVTAPAPRATPTAPTAGAASRYPLAPRVDLVEDIAGQKVADPYRPLEDLDAPATTAWVNAENELTDRTLGQSPARAAFRERLATLVKMQRNYMPVVRGERLFWPYDSGVTDQPVVLMATAKDDTPKTVLDPNVVSPDGKLSLAGFVPSEDGTKLAYGMAAGGGDWQTWHVREVATSKDLPDELPRLKYYRPFFTLDGRGLYYARFPAPAAGHELSEPDHDCKVYFHALGTPSSADRVVYERPDHPSWQFRPNVTEDGQYLVIETGDGEVGDRRQEQIAVLDLKSAAPKPVMLVEGLDAEFVYVGSEGTTFYLLTNLNAAKKKVIAVDLRTPERARWKDVVAPGPNAIEGVSLVGRQLIVNTMQDAHSLPVAYDLGGKKLREVPLPGLGLAFGFGGRRSTRATYFIFESFTTPPTTYRYDLDKGTATPWRASSLAFDPAAFETKQVFYPAKDGTKVPMFITGKKGFAPTGQTATLLTGYGFGGIPYLPGYGAMELAWLEHGGLLAVANIRGGGEYGEEWHHAAMVEKKQVSYDDFTAGAEYLIRERYTTSAHLGIFGTSGGGNLVGTAETQRPELFGAVAPLVGVHDLMRFHLFGEGAGWAGDWGSPTVPAEALNLLKHSPLHNVHPGTRYPATYIVTSDHDVRVAPLHSYKFAATLQAAQAGPAPILMRVRTSAGHGGATTKTAAADNDAELLAFFAQYLEAPR